VEHGKDYEGPVATWKTVVVCGCGAKLEIAAADLFRLHWSLPGGTNCGGDGFQCPECGGYNSLVKLPSNIHNNLDNLAPIDIGCKYVFKGHYE
jgi:hypothetical protein